MQPKETFEAYELNNDQNPIIEYEEMAEMPENIEK